MKRHIRRPLIIEPHAVQNRLILRQPKQPGGGIPRLASRCHRPQLRVTKPDRVPHISQPPVLIETGSQPQRLRKHRAKHFLRQDRIIHLHNLPHQPVNRSGSGLQHPQGGGNNAMDPLRGQPEHAFQRQGIGLGAPRVRGNRIRSHRVLSS